MNQEEGCLLLLHRANLLAPTDALDAAPPALFAQAKELVDAVDGLPLALDQAAAYIEETGCSLGEYLELYQQRRIDLLRWQSNGVSNYSHSSVSNTWQLSFQRALPHVTSASATNSNFIRCKGWWSCTAAPDLLFLLFLNH